MHIRFNYILMIKYVIILVSFISFTNYALSQNCDELKIKGDDLIKNNNIQELINTLDSTFIKCNKSFQTNSIEEAIFYLFSGIIAFKENNIELSKKHLLHSKNILISINDTTNVLHITIQILADRCLSTKKYEEAESYYTEVINLKKNIYGDTSIGYSLWLHKLANFYYLINEYKKAEDTYLKIINIYEIILFRYEPLHRYALMSLADLYFNVKDYEKAKKIYRQLENFLKLFQFDDQQLIEVLNRLADIYLINHRYDDAEVFYKEIVELNKRVYGEKDIEYANCLIDFSLVYFKKNNFEKADSLFRNALIIISDLYGKDHIKYYEFIAYWASLHKDYANYLASLNLYEDLFKSINYSPYKDSELYANILFSLVNIYVEVDAFTSALNLKDSVFRIYSILYGKESINYAILLAEFSVIYRKSGQYLLAEELCKQSLLIKMKLLGAGNTEYIISLINLSAIYYDLGDFTKAANILFDISNNDNIRQNNIDVYFLAKRSLAEVYRISGQYSKSESTHLEVIKILTENKFYNYEDYAISYYNFGLLYHDLNNLIKAEYFYNKAISILINNNNYNSFYASCLNALASLYVDLKKYNEVENLYTQVINIRRRVYGIKHSEYAEALNNLANFYIQMCQYDRSVCLLEEALIITRNSLGETHPRCAKILSNLSFINLHAKKFHASFINLTESISIDKINFGHNSIIYANSLINLACLNLILNNFIQSNINFKQSLSIIRNELLQSLAFMSFSEASSYINSFQFTLSAALSLIYKKPDLDVKETLFDINLFLKNLLLSTNDLLTKEALKSIDSTTRNLWGMYKDLKLQISILNHSPRKSPNDLIKLNDELVKVEKELMRIIPSFNEGLINNNLKWKDIQSKLNSNDIVIDFVEFRLFNEYISDTTLYAAFLIRPEWTEPKFVNLFREEQLAALFDSTNNSISINKLYNNNSTLYNLIWQPMDSLLTGVKRVYVSPSGLLHRISLSAIPVPEGGNLNDRYDIHVMGNVRALAEKQTKTDNTPNSSFLYGGIDYDNEPAVTMTAAPSYEVVTDSTLRSLRGGKWSFLKGTSDEVSRIKTISSTNGLSTKVFSKATASEEAFKSLGKDNTPVPSILHIATHGFAFSTPENRPKNDDRMMMISMQEDRRYVFRQTTDPLTRAGLVMAGGNKVWSTGQTYPNKEDGILTAREISNMDLRGCMLATLSACETGLGEIKGSEGVFGLQRAFKMAGLQHLIVSLWKVPDRETSEFMETFYTNWLTNKLPLREAFRQTQQVMSKKYKPYQWAAFVLVE